MADYIEISTDALDNDRRRMDGELHGIQKELKQLQEEMRQLDAMWEGPAKQTFEAQFMADCEMLDEICDNVSGYISCMDDAGAIYRKCESQVADLVAAIGV